MTANYKIKLLQKIEAALQKKINGGGRKIIDMDLEEML